MNHAPEVSLLVASWNRRHHLGVQLRWLERERKWYSGFELILAEYSTQEEEPSNHPDWVSHVLVRHSEKHGFNKSRLLNAAANNARGHLVMIVDVDLLPDAGVLERHVRLAAENPNILPTGYRLDVPLELFDDELPEGGLIRNTILQSGTRALCPEDNGTALLKHLLKRHRFGVCPCLPRDLFHAIGGMDEGFCGWGGEDEDLVERICQSGSTLARCPDLLYFHIAHQRTRGWNEKHLTDLNRQRLHSKRLERDDSW